MDWRTNRETLTARRKRQNRTKAGKGRVRSDWTNGGAGRGSEDWQLDQDSNKTEVTETRQTEEAALAQWHSGTHEGKRFGETART